MISPKFISPSLLSKPWHQHSIDYLPFIFHTFSPSFPRSRRHYTNTSPLTPQIWRKKRTNKITVQRTNFEPSHRSRAASRWKFRLRKEKRKSNKIVIKYDRILLSFARTLSEPSPALIPRTNLHLVELASPLVCECEWASLARFNHDVQYLLKFDPFWPHLRGSSFQ